MNSMGKATSVHMTIGQSREAVENEAQHPGVNFIQKAIPTQSPPVRPASFIGLPFTDTSSCIHVESRSKSSNLPKNWQTDNNHTHSTQLYSQCYSEVYTQDAVTLTQRTTYSPISGISLSCLESNLAIMLQVLVSKTPRMTRRTSQPSS